MATAVRAFSSAPAPPGAGGGVSMVQGASRGIVLEFVSTQTLSRLLILSIRILSARRPPWNFRFADLVSRLSIYFRR
jgi:hypothetical protein